MSFLDFMLFVKAERVKREKQKKKTLAQKKKAQDIKKAAGK